MGDGGEVRVRQHRGDVCKLSYRATPTAALMCVRKWKRRNRPSEKGDTRRGGARGLEGVGGAPLQEKIPASNLRIRYLCSVRIHLGDSADLTGPTSVWWHINHVQAEREVDWGRGRGLMKWDINGWKLLRIKVFWAVGRQRPQRTHHPPWGSPLVT